MTPTPLLDHCEITHRNRLKAIAASGSKGLTTKARAELRELVHGDLQRGRPQ